MAGTSPAAIQFNASNLGCSASQSRPDCSRNLPWIRSGAPISFANARHLPVLEFSLSTSRRPTQLAASTATITMPPLSATTEHVKPFVLVPVKGSKTARICQDGWREKGFQHQEVAEPKKRKQNFIKRTLGSLTHHHNKEESQDSKKAYDEHSYKDELRQYIAESSANLRYDDDEPLGSSDEDTSDEDSDSVSFSPHKAEIIDYSASIVSISSDKTEECVKPPVEVPPKYRTQDRQGGVLVAGHHVLFTNWAFKRQMRQTGRLDPLPERGDAQLPYMDEAVEEVSIGMYSGTIVEL